MLPTRPYEHRGGLGTLILALLVIPLANWPLAAADQPQWGQRFTRNQVAAESNLPDSFDPETGRNIKWAVPMGTETYATPIVADGRVYIGTNNAKPRDPRHQGDRGILLCLDEADGHLLWHLVVPKLVARSGPPDPYLDWPGGGIVSAPTIEGDRVYVNTNRGEIVCLDVKGITDGNDGPYRDEARHQAPYDQDPIEPSGRDADILWLFDMIRQAGTYPHDASHSSILLHDRYLYLNTSNGVDNTHRRIRAPQAPSLIVLDKDTGALVARDDEGIGPRIFHSTWSSPALGSIDGRPLIFFGGGDGVCYAFEALGDPPVAGEVQTLRRVWRFDCDPDGPKDDVHQYLRNRTTSPSNIKGMPVFYKNRVYVAAGGDIWWGKNQAWLKCIDATGTGDVTATGRIWSCELSQHCCSTPAIADGLVFITDCGGLIHCLDAETGKTYWTHDAEGAMWASPLVADGKVYVGTRRRDFWILQAAKTKKVLFSIRLDSPVSATAVAANGVVYVATDRTLYALQQTAP
ncbi:MAG: PQQ-binding-like beta-propeller repeat protein [Sedimentisphaerales bacterium]|nr:PQQ-binding-like beta-propeller repeat protein [Sedimentisphaerales bacterium]